MMGYLFSVAICSREGSHAWPAWEYDRYIGNLVGLYSLFSKEMLYFQYFTTHIPFKESF
jgi:hypothetical protein